MPEDNLLKQKLQQPLLLPDGSNYFQFITENMVTPAAAAAIINTVALGNQVRVIFEDPEYIPVFIKTYLNTELAEGIQIDYMNTFFFEFDLSQEHLLHVRPWQELSTDFNIVEEDNLTPDIVETMINSFAFNHKTKEVNEEVKQRIENTNNITNANTQLYSIRDYDGNLLASFIVHIHGDEVQAHSLAGMVTGKHQETSGKVKYIASALVHLLKNNPKYAGKKLTFSSLRVAELYKRIGFQVSARNGIVLKSKNIE